MTGFYGVGRVARPSYEMTGFLDNRYGTRMFSLIAFSEPYLEPRGARATVSTG